ncbi:PAS domain S-box-containing protein [Carboxydocella sporoproducens DSM 16521]|uniref:PAS domain S-box-containing protein n=2 Tax=Carboxydocella TaxID=178898 RepID=A0A1T4Q8W5_9FIRM|nr:MULTISPECIES: HD domain-containing phosphohydrolase [Carboxydocella]AVX19337.1 PAS domain S-box-containing protein [Carboxydocella thermautotrophica]AVX29751.1 PAS domain S-box-containing protein [Carboxydocella thermautotrophica]GAW27439.1 PAS domain S-box-containing protein [Carboxydocella sp. ULO1]SKA00076.1 PAS domain S-box-containing protein [Carboxydocella sporoproducens DSM 16521]
MRKKRYIINGIYGFIIGLLIPFFATVVEMLSTGVTLSWQAFWATHFGRAWFLLVDMVPPLIGILLARLTLSQEELLNQHKELVAIKKHLEEQNRLWETIFQSTPIAYALIDKDYTFKRINRAAIDIVGMPTERVLERHCFEILGRNSICPGCAVARAFVSKAVESQVKEEFSGGQRRIVEQVAVPLIENGAVEQVLEIIIDKTQERMLLQQRTEEMLATIDILVGLIELKDQYTGGHSQRVRRWAGLLARYMNLPQELVEQIEMAASLHDIGKIGIAGMILNKPHCLCPEEKDIVRRHPVIGQEALAGLEQFEEIALMIRSHHERWDGQGYPDGLAGKDIPLGARIIGVVDAYDAMISDRAYRKALDQDEAVAELKKGAGQQFDPEIVRCFCELLEKKNNN